MLTGQRDAERRQDERVGQAAERAVGILPDQKQKPVVADDRRDVADHARALQAGSARNDI